MVFVGAVILPHGAMPFDGDQNSFSAACRERYKTLTPGIREKCTKVRPQMHESPQACPGGGVSGVPTPPFPGPPFHL